MTCPRCGRANPDDVRFCNGCGVEFSSEPACPRCERKNPRGSSFCNGCGQRLAQPVPQPSLEAPPSTQPPPVPTSFASGRYQVKKFLGEGGKKKVYLAHDSVLDRDVAFALIKTEKLDEAGRTRIKREAQAMGRLDHPNIVSILDFGDHEGQPYMVLPLLSGGDVEGLIKKAAGHKLSLDRSIEIAISVCKGLEFAHARGIIHRDIKPGNIWMSADGTAKVGDFGLAVAVELSRLTGDGMMVGTVSYMPPEQAMGGKVNARADLYSLGAMLYEMVAGRPPFVGDDSIAVIGQHINTPPVSPTWHRADLPPALETLIMRLLEKDPEKRPPSATVVLQALEGIGAGKAAKEPAAATAAPEGDSSTTLGPNPIYRRVFVGREQELKHMQAAFDGAMSGRGALAVVAGEPGIGKTSFCEQLGTYVKLRGGRTLVGHCYEKGSLSLPYLAFVEALRTYVLDRPPDELRKEMGSGAGDVARIVSEVRERLRVESRPAGDPEEERYRLLQAVTEFLVNASNVQPLYVVLEDLHDADRGTLEMLTHLSRNLEKSRLLIVGTYRDVEVDRTHPLSASLAELRRIPTFTRVGLRGLTADEVQRMLQSAVEQEIPWGLAEAVHRQTEGNPLFVQEVLRYLVEEGIVARDGGKGKASGSTPVALAIPEGLRDVIGKRLSRLSERCNKVLAIAAVIGREFSLQVLQLVLSRAEGKVAGVNEEELYTALEEATAAAVIEERSAVGKGSSFRFQHAFFRQTLYEELFAPRRIRTHQQVGKALEEVYAQRLEDHAAELAAHFSQSTEAGDLAKAVKYGEIAAKRALSVYAYGEAVRLYEECLKAQEVLDPDDKARQCDLLLALGETLIDAGEPLRYVNEIAPKTFALAEAISDSHKAFLVSRLAYRGMTSYGQGPALATAHGELWMERLDRYAAPNSRDRVDADLLLGFFNRVHARIPESRRLTERGLDLARKLEDNEAFLWAAGEWLFSGPRRGSGEERLKLSEEMLQKPRSGVSERALFQSLSRLVSFFVETGQRGRLEEISGEVHAIAERSQQANRRLSDMRFQSMTATIDGRLQEAADIALQMLAIGSELGLVENVRVLIANGIDRTFLELGRVQEVVQVIQEIPAAASDYLQQARVCLSRAYLGKSAEAAEILDKLAPAKTQLGPDHDTSDFSTDLRLLEAATLVRHVEATTFLLRRFAVGTHPPFDALGLTCAFRLLGAAKALLGRYEEARVDYKEALRASTEFRFRPEVALTRLGLGELLLDHYPAEKKDALEHLDFAIKEFREMKMQPSLEQALRHKEILKA